MIKFLNDLLARFYPTTPVRSEPTEPTKSYKIIHDPQLGYLPAFDEGYLGWYAINEQGFTAASVRISADPLFPRLWVATKEEAGERINLHATSRGQTEVWSA